MLKPPKRVQAWKSFLRICASISLKTSLGLATSALMWPDISEYIYMHIGCLVFYMPEPYSLPG